MVYPSWKIIWSGIVATAVMSFLIFISPLLGFSRLAVWEIIASRLGVSVIIGWLVHFLIGIIFAFLYFYLKKYFRFFEGVGGGLLFGFGIFVGVQIFTLTVLGGGGNILLALGSLVGHLVFGGVLGGLQKS